MARERKKWQPIELTGLRTVSIKERQSKVSVADLARPWSKGNGLLSYLDKLPSVLAGRDLREIVRQIVAARESRRVVLLGMGAHPIKVGLSPIIIDLMKREVLSGVALNGAGIIHDFEMAFAGETSEDVERVISDGSFGMTKETAEFLNSAIYRGYEKGIGLGRAVGEAIALSSFQHKDLSILAAGVEQDVPVTVHVAIGTDVIHMHPGMDGAATGFCSHVDFRIFARLVSELDGGIYINLGSAVIMPEVFLKAVSLARNLGADLKRFITVNMDFMRHYRPHVNVVNRPPGVKGRGYSLIGHHEIMFPLLAGLVIEKIEEKQ